MHGPAARARTVRAGASDFEKSLSDFLKSLLQIDISRVNQTRNGGREKEPGTEERIETHDHVHESELERYHGTQ